MQRDDSTTSSTARKFGKSEKEWEVRIPISALQKASQSLSDRALVVLMHIEGYARKADQCFPSNDRLMADTGKSRRSLQEAMAELTAKGFIRREFKGKRPIIRLLSRVSLREQPLEYEDISTDGGCGIPHARGAEIRTHKYYEENKGGEDLIVSKQTRAQQVGATRSRISVNRMSGVRWDEATGERTDHHDAF